MDATSAKAGDWITVTTTVQTDAGEMRGVKVTAIDLTVSPKTELEYKGACPPPPKAASCTLGTVGTEPEAITTLVRAPQETKSKVTLIYKVTLSGTASEGKSLAGVNESPLLTFTPSAKTPPPKTPTKKPTKKPPKPTKKPTKSPSHNGGGSGGGGSSGGSGGTGGGGTGNSGSGTGGVLPPAPNSSFDPRNPQVALPPIASPVPQNPSVAPSPALAPQSRLQGNNAPVAQDLTFERIASTQIAWLAALMVAFSLLLTQVRLGRRRQPAEDPKRLKGTHRRPRKGVFGK
ncbi:hypothetical protein FXF68_02010 [Actinomadura decatromicini]|uniref:Uncharacterized protein n=1 Tax=Actinomadura decatromicini TaxID=2604572 RepID=A0A5D3FX32_9ACTN|nr:hypothetical protein FXF68_02010 [Actinomadura decatromicini]